MSETKQNTRILRKASRSNVLDNNEVQRTTLPQRVFLYLHPKSITYPLDDIPSDRSEIEVKHRYNTIRTLSDHFTPRNVIPIDQFDVVKPTFSITITQDSLEDITMLSDSPILLTLYVYTNRKSKLSEVSKNSITDEEDFQGLRTPVAQGHIDIIEYFNSKRIRYTDTVFLYPLKNYGQTLTCKTEWDIYSLHPLLKTVQFSNFVFITLGSLYNMSEDLMDDAENLVANLSFISKTPRENNEYDKVFICNFKAFSKSIISQQNLTKSWESLKSREFENINCMGIASESNINLNQLFSNLLSTDNADLNFNRIKINEDFALICNSMHRYVLADNMQKILEDVLSRNLYSIIVEIHSERDESKTLLEGYIDLSLFMYPNVNNCSFAVELRPPDYKTNYQATAKESARIKRENNRRKSKTVPNTQEQLVQEEKIPFAIIKIWLLAPITNPCAQNITEISKRKAKGNKFSNYTAVLTNNAQTNLSFSIDRNYRAFDDLVGEILDYIIRNNIQTLNDDKEFFCNQISNLNNKIMKLVACDFNVKTPTKTNIEFTNLITVVYRDLISRIYDCINKCSIKSLKDCMFTMTREEQHFMVENMSIAKYLFEVGNLEMANIFMNQLRSEYPNNSILKFYIFLYDIERQNFELVEKYLKSPLVDKNIEGELFADLIQIYINYKRQLQDSEKNQAAIEDLIKALSDYSISHTPKSLTAFILLYCLYKRHNYQAGMTYCRWRYENLYENTFVKLEFIPKSRWEIYMPYKIKIKSTKGRNFYKVCDKLLRLGLYNFAQWVFEEIANECTEIEKYLFSSTFAMLEKKLGDKMSIKTFSMDKYAIPMQLRATLSLVNGNLEHFRVAYGSASLKHYQDLNELNELEEYEPYQLGLLRYAYKMMEEKKYEEASRTFLNLCHNNVNCIVAAVGNGKASYYLDQLDEAEKYFALSTEHNIYMANTWEYLALINLKKGNNYNALECWKYSRLNKNVEIHEEIINELKKISYSDLFLFVDVPNKI